MQERIEADLVYPAVRGSDISRWSAKRGVYVLMVQDPEKSEPYSEKRVKKDWPYTFNYLTRFKDVLLSRGSRTVRELAERTAFYAMFGIGKYTVARYKVVWKRMAGDLVAAVVSQAKTDFGWKMMIPTDTTAFFAAQNEDEAHYLCAVINSAPVREFIRSYSSAGRGFGAPSVMENVGVPKFNPKNGTHAKLSELSKMLHKVKAEGNEAKVYGLEQEVDEVVWDLFGATK